MKTYYGIQTKQAHENFPFPLPSVSLELIYAIAEIKKASAEANCKTKILDKDRCNAIKKACDEITAGVFDSQFHLPGLQGGAGTSINMNVNEVIASRATEILEEEGKDLVVHPNDHVNLSQSTNDVNPSALRIAAIRLTDTLLDSVTHLIKTFRAKAKEYKNVQKLGRTHVQDAVPTTIGEEFSSYVAILERDHHRIIDAREYLFDLNLGGTAIGNKINASEKYIDAVYAALEKETSLTLQQADNFMSLTSSTTDFCYISSAITILALDLSKIATDLRFLSSGPNGGIGEISLQALQPGSSIMPGKVNPVAPESMNQIYYFISGKNQTIHQAAEGACLELAIMFPVIADSLISSLKLLSSGINMFADRCIAPLTVSEKRCKELLEKSTAFATLLTPVLGYDTVSEAVKKTNRDGTSLREIVLQEKLLTEKEFDAIVQL